MRAVDLIRQKRDGGMLDAASVRAFVAGVTSGEWADYQIAAMLMAIVLRGMTLEETSALTSAMVDSGVRLDLSEWGVAVDKHSTGGVGDKLSLVIAPLAAACGAIVPMMSGRALGHTGGTLDKLDSIPGFRTRLSLAEMRAGIARTGCVLMGQTDEIAPADKRLYALRDVTATVESLPLIAASILSKKIAEGIGALVLDVKVGRGAFLKDDADMRALAGWIVSIAAENGVRAEAVMTAMDAPLGNTVGNACEVVEAIATLHGRGPEDIERLSVLLAARMLVLSGRAGEDDAEARVRRALHTGAGLDKFREIIEAQGGDPRVIDTPAVLSAAAHHAMWRAPRAGYVAALDAELIGRAANVLGAGRRRVEDEIDHAAGIRLYAKPGVWVSIGEPVLELAANDERAFDMALALVDQAVEIDDVPPRVLRPLVIDSVTPAMLH